MSDLPSLKRSKLLKAFQNLGFKQASSEGSHVGLRHPDGRKTTVYIHKGRELSPVVLAEQIKELGISKAEFLLALKKKVYK